LDIRVADKRAAPEPKVFDYYIIWRACARYGSLRPMYLFVLILSAKKADNIKRQPTPEVQTAY